MKTLNADNSADIEESLSKLMVEKSDEYLKDLLSSGTTNSSDSSTFDDTPFSLEKLKEMLNILHPSLINSMSQNLVISPQLAPIIFPYFEKKEPIKEKITDILGFNVIYSDDAILKSSTQKKFTHAKKKRLKKKWYKKYSRLVPDKVLMINTKDLYPKPLEFDMSFGAFGKVKLV